MGLPGLLSCPDGQCWLSLHLRSHFVLPITSSLPTRTDGGPWATQDWGRARIGTKCPSIHVFTLSKTERLLCARHVFPFLQPGTVFSTGSLSSVVAQFPDVPSGLSASSELLQGPFSTEVKE